ncbi:hypothetical protein P280DRAFT_505712 [Massarina eburnea CBS 473.64]|uniref:Uncharacterized protein n=1 Tax=Massarina eburnea CBS 473.64 TaxID=1395130 RepID=A0A6A6S7I7_9PLEO|nr:hypothetical protein P280DRAFT_505712 [Massarina eburnea CBS 473.64]
MAAIKRAACPSAYEMSSAKKHINNAGLASDASKYPINTLFDSNIRLDDLTSSADTSPPNASARPKKAAKSPTAKANKAKGKAIPLKHLFDHKPKATGVKPKYNEAWGRKPFPGPNGLQPHPDQPPAHSSNGQTVPALWEDRKYRYKKGSRFVKSFRKGLDIAGDGPDLDQEDLLTMTLIDMRPKSKKDSTPRRVPEYYVYPLGRPLDWDNKQAIKALNDRRQQAIERITLDKNWTMIERECLASIFRENPDVSILEATERFNARFMNQDFAMSTAFAWDNLSDGRTVESVRHEYLMFRELYNAGVAPQKKELADKSDDGKAASKKLIEVFGKPDAALLRDIGDDSDEGSEKPKKARTPPNKPDVTMSMDRNEATESTLSEYDVELLALAGALDEDEHSQPQEGHPRPQQKGTYIEPASSRRDIQENYSDDDDEEL